MTQSGENFTVQAVRKTNWYSFISHRTFNYMSPILLPDILSGGSMLDQRWRRWPNIEPSLNQSVFWGEV